MSEFDTTSCFFKSLSVRQERLLFCSISRADRKVFIFYYFTTLNELPSTFTM